MRMTLRDQPLNLRPVTGHRIWLGALGFIEWLSRRRISDSLAQRTVVELGCGTGLCGLALAALGARSVTMTDIDAEVCDLALANLELNALAMPCKGAGADDVDGGAGGGVGGVGGVDDVGGVGGDGGGDGGGGGGFGGAEAHSEGCHGVETLAWGDDGAAVDLLAKIRDRTRTGPRQSERQRTQRTQRTQGGADLVVAADCIYSESVIVPIIKTAATLMRGSGGGGDGCGEGGVEVEAGGGIGGDCCGSASDARFVLVYVPRCASPDAEVRHQIEEAAIKAGMVFTWDNRVFDISTDNAGAPAGDLGEVGEVGEGAGAKCAGAPMGWVDGSGGCAPGQVRGSTQGAAVRAELRDVNAAVFVARLRC